MSWGDEGHEGSGEEAYMEHGEAMHAHGVAQGDAMHAYGVVHGEAMHAYAAVGGNVAWHAECTSPCLAHGPATDHSHALGQGGLHLSSRHPGLSEGIHIHQDQHGQYYWECLAPCGYVGPTRGSEQEANDDADEHREHQPRHQYYVSVVDGQGDDDS